MAAPTRVKAVAPVLLRANLKQKKHKNSSCFHSGRKYFDIMNRIGHKLFWPRHKSAPSQRH